MPEARRQMPEAREIASRFEQFPESSILMPQLFDTVTNPCHQIANQKRSFKRDTLDPISRSGTINIGREYRK